jgi:hypothetical protein
VGGVKGPTHKRKHKLVNVPKVCGLAASVREMAACEGRAGWRDGLGRIHGEIQIGI